jgi:hypothetical protein
VTVTVVEALPKNSVTASRTKLKDTSEDTIPKIDWRLEYPLIFDGFIQKNDIPEESWWGCGGGSWS